MMQLEVKELVAKTTGYQDAETMVELILIIGKKDIDGLLNSNEYYYIVLSPRRNLLFILLD